MHLFKFVLVGAIAMVLAPQATVIAQATSRSSHTGEKAVATSYVYDSGSYSSGAMATDRSKGKERDNTIRRLKRYETPSLDPILFPTLPEFQKRQTTATRKAQPRPQRVKPASRITKQKIIWPPVLNVERPVEATPTTGQTDDHSQHFGATTGFATWHRSPKPSVFQHGQIFNHEFGFINPSYPYPFDTPMIRPSGWDTHEGWVSKYLYTRSSVSPYMELFRHDVTPYGSNLYYTLVRPDMEKREYQRPALPAAPTFHGSPTMHYPAFSSLVTGHPAHFFNGVTSNLEDMAILGE